MTVPNRALGALYFVPSASVDAAAFVADDWAIPHRLTYSEPKNATVNGHIAAIAGSAGAFLYRAVDIMLYQNERSLLTVALTRIATATGARLLVVDHRELTDEHRVSWRASLPETLTRIRDDHPNYFDLEPVTAITVSAVLQSLKRAWPHMDLGVEIVSPDAKAWRNRHKRLCQLIGAATLRDATDRNAA